MSDVNVNDVSVTTTDVVKAIAPDQIIKVAHTGLVFLKILAQKQGWTQVVTWVDFIDSFVNDPEVLAVVLTVISMFSSVSKEEVKQLVEVIKTTLKK